MRTLIVALGILALTVSVGAMAAQRAASQDALGPPEGSGLVVVEVGFERSQGFKIFGGGAQNVRGRLVWLGDTPRVVEAVESRTLIVFSGLQPGPYRLDTITATMKSSKLSWPLEAQLSGDDARFSVDVRAGTPIYLGKVTVVDHARMFRVGGAEPPTSTIDNSAPLVAGAWKRFLAVHGKTAWAARVREHLAGGGATAALASAEAPSAAITPLQRIEALVREADAAEENGTVRNFLDQRKSALAAAESDLAAQLKSYPDDADAMLMGVRLAWLRESRTAIRLESAAGPDVAAPDDAFVALAAIADRVITLQADNAAAHFWKARIAAVELPAIRDGVLVKVSRDLPQAVASAQRAVELEPTNVMYRQALAMFLVMDDRPGEALEAVRDLAGAGGAPHPIASILSAWQALPLPENAQEQRLMALGFTDIQVDQGKITSYPIMRVRMYTVQVRAAEVEAFYKARWKTFKLFGKGNERHGDMRTSAFGQFLRWNNGKLEPVTSERQLDDAADRSPGGDGLLMMVNEVINLPPEIRTRFAGATGDTFCHISFMNTVSMGR